MPKRTQTRQVRPRGKPYVHQGFLSFAKKLAPLNRIGEIFEQNRIHLKERKYTPTGILIELGSHKAMPGGLMATRANVQTLADAFGLKTVSRSTDTGRLEATTRDHAIIPFPAKLAPLFQHPRQRLEIPLSKTGRQVGRFRAIDRFIDSKGNPVFAYYHYSRRASPPSQATLHRWFVEFFPHPLSERIAKALSERNATFIGKRFSEWMKRTKKLPITRKQN
ncbi:MAG: hypothetical protein IPJ89_04695 [Candidatus Iainarchaeum archaeon]|uniref:Uncharacterized protein n=1 Tax=Candidatus Iainarchaeum sp. TaxID=3101447 RepID=A0A7T9I1J7_9ARCH|nr:MAG: hypothetical protein IPJ89_04695 [Candidatus Diapherotrites archaeon]